MNLQERQGSFQSVYLLSRFRDLLRLARQMTFWKIPPEKKKAGERAGFGRFVGSVELPAFRMTRPVKCFYVKSLSLLTNIVVTDVVEAGQVSELTDVVAKVPFSFGGVSRIVSDSEILLNLLVAWKLPER